MHESRSFDQNVVTRQYTKPAHNDSSYGDKCVSYRQVCEWEEKSTEGQRGADDGSRSGTSYVKVRKQIDRRVWLSRRIGIDVPSCAIRRQSWQEDASECYCRTQNTCIENICILMKSREYWLLEKLRYFEGRLLRKIGSHNSEMLLLKLDPTINCRLVFHLIFVIHAVVQLGFLVSGPLLTMAVPIRHYEL